MSRSFKDCVSSISFSSSDKILLISVNEKKGCLDRKCGNQGKFNLCHLEVFIITTIDIKIEMPFSCATHSLSWFSMLFCLNGFKILPTFVHQGKHCTDNVQTAPTWRQQWNQHFDCGELGTRNQNPLVQIPEHGTSPTIVKLLKVAPYSFLTARELVSK